MIGQTISSGAANTSNSGYNGCILRESTVNNLLNPSKYGQYPQVKNSDAFTYLRFGLPRVKATSNIAINNQNNNSDDANQNSKQSDQRSSSHINLNQNKSNQSNRIEETSTSTSISMIKQQHQNRSNYGRTKMNGNNLGATAIKNNHLKNGRLNGSAAAINEELKRRFWNESSTEFNLLQDYENESDSSGREFFDSNCNEQNNHSQASNHHQKSHHHHHHLPHHHSHHHHQSQSDRRSPVNYNQSDSHLKSSSSSRFNQQQQSSAIVDRGRTRPITTKPQSNRAMNDFIGNGIGFRNGGAIGAGAGAGGGGEGGGGLLNENIYHHHKDSNHSGNHQQPIHHPITSPNFHSNPNQNHLEPDDHGSPFNDTDIENDADDSVGNLDEPFVMPDNNLHSTTLPPPLAKHPHLVVKDLMYEVDKSSSWRRLCGLSRHKLRILEDISFDVHGGELMAIMATSAHEGTTLLNVLGAKHDHRNGTVRAEIYLNGVLISPKHLCKLMAYVTKNIELCSEMSTRQALLFAGLLIGPASRSTTDVKRFTRTLLEELNLGEVRHTKLSELTYSERKRLHIAIHLLLDTELLMIDQPLLGLDIFDSFFLIEYLRQWAIVGGRAVIMTVSPPNFEIFTMIHKVLLMSAGRSLYVGHRKDMIKYFSSIGYPCPPYKNPSDYYLDLITLDDLSQEALIESSQRIETLAEIQNRRSIMEIFSSMPGPPSVLPAPFRRANLAMQFLALWIRALIFGFPYNAINLFGRFIITLLLSLMIGAIFWQVRGGREQEFVWDRIGFINTMLSIGIVPILIFELINAFNEKRYVLSDVYQGFYSLPIYLFSKLLYSMPQTILTGLAYALPACSMAGLQQHSNPNSLPFYLLLMLAHYMALRSFLFVTVWLCRRRSTATIFFGLIFTIFVLSSGTNIQYRDISITHRWLRQLSPIRWIHEAMIAWEFEPNSITSLNGNDDGIGVTSSGIMSSSASSSSSLSLSFLCSRNPVIQQPNAILVRADCGFQTRSNVLKWFEYQGGNNFDHQNLRPSWHAFIALLSLYFGSFLIGSIIFCFQVYYYQMGWSEINDDGGYGYPLSSTSSSSASTSITTATSNTKYR